MIPKIIHQTYKQEDNLPLVYKECQTILCKLHEDWTYMFWTDEKMYAEVKESFPDLYEVFMKLPRKIMQIDVFRYCLMWKYGGLYADLDYRMRKTFDMLDAELVLPMSRMPTAKQTIRFGNCIFASKPGHPFWKFVLDDIIQNTSHLDMVTDSDVMDSENGTGPGFVTRMYLTCPQEVRETIMSPERYAFHPPSSYGEKELAKNGSYGVHLCESVWTKGRL